MPTEIPLLAGGAALAAGLVLVPLAAHLARRRGWVAVPRADRWHRRPTALMGGLGIYAATVAGLGASGALAGELPLVGLLCGATVMMGLGAVDDRRSVMPRPKLLTELACTGLAFALEVRALPGAPWWVGLPVTALWVVGLTNALNLLDNMDGLAGGAAALGALALGGILLGQGDQGGAAFAFAVAGSTLAFLRENRHPARVFMGDCGSLFLGYALAVLALRAHGGAWAAGPVRATAIPLVLLCVPIADTTLVTVMRLWNGRPVSQGGRDHASHRLVYLGLSEPAAVGVLHGACAAAGAAAWALAGLHPQAGAIAAAATVGVTLLLFIRLARVDAYRRPAPPAPPPGPAPADHRAPGTLAPAAGGRPPVRAPATVPELRVGLFRGRSAQARHDGVG